MNKLIIGIIGGLIGLIVIVAVAATQKKSFLPVSRSLITPPAPKASAASFKQYTDPSGFTFQYPDSFTIAADKLTDNQIYASVSIASRPTPGTISLKIEASGLKKIDDWFTPPRKNIIYGEIKSIKLAGLEARQFISNNQKVTLAADEGVLISITQSKEADDELFNPAYEKIISTFAFSQPTNISPSQTSPDTTEDGVIFEGEEAIE